MYLKSIEIQGFKSFANKIVFEFHNGITGIVGPNGSGKSNVADAVRWVLGEQKVKQLRSSNMQDVIFSGTELRKPQGFAYVAITLDNSDHQLTIDYESVTVSRRVYRSGESEYMINGSACRLKDINELFYDTGIGKEGYSIIGQGQIDKILSGKPEERRELFDEAAGIVKFKRRKAIAQKKLEDERQNLIRLLDILSELEKQVGPLEKQSEAAKEYLRLKEELKKYDVNVFLVETEELRSQLSRIKERERIVSNDLQDAKRDCEAARGEYDALDGKLSGLEDEITQKRSQLGETNLLKGSLEGQINVLQEQINTEKMNAEHIGSRMSAIRSDLEEKERQTGGYEQERIRIAEAMNGLTGRLTEAKEAVSQEDAHIHELEQQIESGKSEIIDTLNKRASVTAGQQRYETMLESVSVRRSEVCQKLLKFKSDESEQEEQLKAFQKQREELEEALSSLAGSQALAESQAEEAELEGKRLNKKLNDKQQEYHTSYTKLESLRNIAERYEGYGGSIRRVMEVRDRVHGIRGVVADLIAVPKQYEIAIETALGGSIQNVVTDSEQTAKQLIEYLKKNRYGRATFLPLTSIGNRNTFTQEQALREPGVIGLANSLVEADAQYEGLMRYLLGRVVVVDTIDHGIALARKFQYALRIVTLEGELLSAGGSMTGGAFKNSSNLLGRKREMEELEAICNKTLLDVERIEKELVINEGRSIECKETLESLRLQKQNLIIEQNTILMNVTQTEDKKTEIQESYGDLERENGQLEEQIRDITGRLADLAGQIRELDSTEASINQKLQTWTMGLEKARADREALAGNLAGIQMEVSAIKQKDDFELENLQRVREEINRLQEELLRLTGGTDESKQAIGEKLLEIQRLEEMIAQTDAKANELAKSIDLKVREREEAGRRQRESFQKREDLTGRVSLLDKEIFRLESQREKLDEQIETHVNYMWDEYELTYTTAEELRNRELGTLADLRRHIVSLKEDIRKLGSVNVNAIEDYKEISERYEFLNNQHADLVAAEETLRKIIDELDAGMRRQFEEKFREIKLEFDNVFKELFGGGRTTLELVEGEDILEAGIQIISQPPGKKLQNMMQLSGGEKALTAIALLFAIQNLKPSPFCLLDEIEAALDDSNVERYAKYLHKLTKYTQFIIITHRRGTMVAADRLYGITMQEKGVSTLVSVNLIEEDLEK